jgi:hypothetical protein
MGLLGADAAGVGLARGGGGGGALEMEGARTAPRRPGAHAADTAAHACA